MSDNGLFGSHSARLWRFNKHAVLGIVAVFTISVLFLVPLENVSFATKLVLLCIPICVFIGGIALSSISSRRATENFDDFERLFMTNDHVLILTNKTGEILLQNKRSESLFGAGADLAIVLADCTDDPGALIYRQIQTATKQGKADFDKVGGSTFRTVFTRATGTGRFLWSFIEKNSDRYVQINDNIAQIRRNPDGKIVWKNSATEKIFLDSDLDLSSQLLDDRLKLDRILRISNEPAGQFRISVIPMDDGSEDILLLPCRPEEMLDGLADKFLDDLPVALARVNADGVIDYVNQSASQLLGERAVPGVRISNIIEGMGRPFKERLAESMRGREQGRSEVARGQIGDREIFLQVTLSRIVKDGEAFVLAVLSDATELKTLEAQFVQSQKMQAVGQLAGGVAHDFNNLLTAINGHCDLMLLRHDSSDTDHADLMQIRQNANRAAALVRQLLAFSRKQTLRPKILHLFDTLSELTHLLNRLLGEKVKLTIEHDPELFPVRVDVRQLEQVVMNLVVNARDAMPDGGVVHLKTRSVVLDEDIERDRATVPMGKYTIIEVSDTGVGIPPDRITKIFEPFYTTKKVGEGTGLGLSTAYGIIKQTGGFIFAESTPGVGTSFQVYLPAFDEESTSEIVEQVTEEKPVSDLSGRGVILLVEDEAPVRSFGTRALQMRGYTVLEAESGEQALEILSDETLHIDLFVSDVVMPGMDGPSWVRAARANRPNVPTIFVSGYAEDSFKNGNSEIPNTSFLAKPFTLNELTENVKEKMNEIAKPGQPVSA